jgi:four helix bundle protein
MTPEELKKRTKEFAILIIKLTETVPSSRPANIITQQLIRSACSVGANYRASCRARSRKEFISKLCIVLEEADETQYWLDLLTESNICTEGHTMSIAKREALELTKIFAVSRKSARNNYRS